MLQWANVALLDNCQSYHTEGFHQGMMCAGEWGEIVSRDHTLQWTVTPPITLERQMKEIRDGKCLKEQVQIISNKKMVLYEDINECVFQT